MPLRDSLPRRSSAQRQPVATTRSAASPPRPLGGKPPPPPVVAWENVTAACGHPEKFGLFEDKRDKYRDARRRKVTDRVCKACRERRQREEQEAAQRRRAERGEGLPDQGRKGRVRAVLGRLPHGARFDVGYDAAAEAWSGTLTVPVPEGAPAVFTASASGVFKLLSRLDRLYRDSLPPNGDRPPQEPATGPVG